jgi:2-iminobutanoate/2-iminopropanoate deaminase
MTKTVITTSGAPAPIGPYNQAILSGNILFISGQASLDPQTGELKNRDIQEETHTVMHNLRAILRQAGMNFSNVVKTTIYLTDLKQFAEMNTIYGKYFEEDAKGNSIFPARETVQVSALPKNANVEISMIAVKEMDNG